MIISGSKYIKLCRNIALTLVFTVAATFSTGSTYAGDSIVEDIKQALRIYYVDELPESVYNQTTVNDILKEINKYDPYTKFYSTNKYTELVNSINNETSGIGVYIAMSSEGAKVIAVLDNTPEKQAGLMVGDTIIMADNRLLVGVTEDTAIRAVKGEAGKTVILRVKRGTELTSINIYREQTPNSTVTGQIIDGHIGYIRVNSFGEDSGSIFSEIIKSYEKKKVKSYIIDLRYNGGGFLQTACDMAGYFIGNNVVIRTKGKLTGEKKYYGKYHGVLINKPLVLLVNKYSASASEILAAALKDYRKAYIVGSKTYGKGSIQWPARLSSKEILKLTIERFYSPKGNPIDKVGVTPDLNVSDDNIALNSAKIVLDSPNYLYSNNGYVNINYNNKNIVVRLSKMQTKAYWQTYKYLLSLASKKGKVMFGSGRDWKAVPKSYLSSVAKMYYPGYKDVGRLRNVDVDSVFTWHFGSSIDKNSFKTNNLELIDVQTGDRVPVDYSALNTKSVTISPIDNLRTNKVYYIVEHPTILKSDSKPIGYGRVLEIETKTMTRNNGSI